LEDSDAAGTMHHMNSLDGSEDPRESK